MGQHYSFVKKLYGEKSTVSSMFVLAFQRNPCLRFNNRFNSLKHVQDFDAHD